MAFRIKTHLALALLLTFIVSVTLSEARPFENSNMQTFDINHDEIINQGIQIVYKENNLGSTLFDAMILTELNNWYNSHPMIEFASLVETTITIKFIDSSYTLIMDIFSLFNDYKIEENEFSSSYNSEQANGNTALILNPAEHMYGYRQCKRIINRLLNRGYNIVYLSNEDVDLRYVENNLSAEIVYMNTHAGYWDIDGDQIADTVVIGTGEYWTDETTQKYQFEYDNQMIIEGMVGDISYIAFTPDLIEYYYNSSDFPNSLIYMATCDATHDDSMANAFLESGADVYMGWTQDTLFWTNSITSSFAFRLLTRGFTVKQVCRIIRSGGFYNFLYRSKLTYYGNGDHRIPR